MVGELVTIEIHAHPPLSPPFQPNYDAQSGTRTHTPFEEGLLRPQRLPLRHPSKAHDFHSRPVVAHPNPSEI